jgi:hypothetical protein
MAFISLVAFLMGLEKNDTDFCVSEMIYVKSCLWHNISEPLPVPAFSIAPFN